MSAYYNEIDLFSAAWLRELIKARLIADGIVDTRSIEDVRPDDLRGFDQCHFFAGIGGWSLALRRAGWPDDRPVWTGSCPCQPFSSAGQGAGFNDERHLWPSFQWLIQERRPAVVAGEQVASKDADPWLDLVQDDLEAMDYAFGAVAFPSAGVGAPHIRDRTYWVAHADSRNSRQGAGIFGGERFAESGQAGRVDDSHHQGLEGQRRGHQADGRRFAAAGSASAPGESVRLADNPSLGWGEQCSIAAGRHERGSAQELEQRSWGGSILDLGGPAGPTNGYWRDADWLFCRDGKWRPVEPGTVPLAHGVPARVGRLRGYGNAINAEQAALFVEVMVECIS
ncbi:DNA cytosine methyltransferase [Herbaspirillum huttiense]|uniref:DNA cytosine methyltransferase n=1 Tax=Herbaspirillum huttiense TaxID=863372 RepID=UPI003B3BAE96